MVIFEAKNGEDLAFSLTKMELFELDNLYPFGFQQQVQSVVLTENIRGMVDMYTDILVKAYGKLLLDGEKKMVVKTAVFSNAFKHSHQLLEVFEAISKNKNVMEQFMAGVVSEKTYRIRRKKH